MKPIATARSNPPFGYKAVVKWPEGRTYQPVRRNFTLRSQAISYAQKWIDTNYIEGGENGSL